MIKLFKFEAPPGTKRTSPFNYWGPQSLHIVTYLLTYSASAKGARCSLYFLFKTTESTAVCLLSDGQQSKVCGQAMTIQPETVHSENAC